MWVNLFSSKKKGKLGTQCDPIRRTNWFRNLGKESQSLKIKEKIQWIHYHYFNLLDTIHYYPSSEECWEKRPRELSA